MSLGVLQTKTCYCGVTLSWNVISHHVVYTWIIFYTLSVETNSRLRACTALICFYVPARLQVLVGANLVNINSAQISCTVSDIILSQIQLTIFSHCKQIVLIISHWRLTSYGVTRSALLLNVTFFYSSSSKFGIIMFQLVTCIFVLFCCFIFDWASLFTITSWDSCSM